MSNPKATPKAIREEVKKDLANSGRGKSGVLQKIAEKWGLTRDIVEDIQKRERKEIMALREGVAERGFMLAARLDERVLEAIEDDDKMAETGLRDMAIAREKLVGSAVTALEGHVAPVQNFNFALIKAADRSVKQYEEIRAKRLAEMKQAKVIDPA